METTAAAAAAAAVVAPEVADQQPNNGNASTIPTEPPKRPKRRAKGKPQPNPLPLSLHPAILPRIGVLLDHIQHQLQTRLHRHLPTTSLLLRTTANLIRTLATWPLTRLLRLLTPANLLWPTLVKTKLQASVCVIRDRDGNPVDCLVWVMFDGLLLWVGGAFGKGILSRSDPTWLRRYLRETGVSGKGKQMFLEDITKQRRLERQMNKGAAAAVAEAEAEAGAEEKNAVAETRAKTGVEAEEKGAEAEEKEAGGSLEEVVEEEVQIDTLVGSEEASEMEPTQLSPYECLFLCDTGCLVPRDSATNAILSANDLWKLFDSLEADFEIKYAAYYYYRSKGWTVRSGIKFGSDFLLYNNGPAHSHAQYSVVVRHRKCLSDKEIDTQENEEDGDGGESRRLVDTWQYMFALTRVTAQVQKTLVVCYVDSPESQCLADRMDLCQYAIEEQVISRFNPNRK
ncbi:tRNA splicing endonuclease subunit sen2 [Kickxella alabastrina]|uniref:tRNA splicing endonuclease subunit sen2 n=1 Tax=Kickxella alabastrina TaxID=61397 RepID=A0ACC1IW83_9FUNG|nr:tRNA splicing endonuclease subunit sen2 [Kickxella alabastrina]